MKKVLFLSLITVFMAAGTSHSLAYSYGHDDSGWYDAHNKHHKFVTHNHHRGYWDTNNGVKVFVNMG
jgi:hypothetical protein